MTSVSLVYLISTTAQFPEGPTTSSSDGPCWLVLFLLAGSYLCVIEIFPPSSSTREMVVKECLSQEGFIRCHLLMTCYLFFHPLSGRSFWPIVAVVLALIYYLLPPAPLSLALVAAAAITIKEKKEDEKERGP